jgi:hypothetical protein
MFDSVPKELQRNEMIDIRGDWCVSFILRKYEKWVLQTKDKKKI